MAGNRSAVLRVLASVADGNTPDWTGVESEPLSTTARDLNVLRAIASLADVHRTLIDVDVVDAEASWTGPGRVVGRIGPAGQRSDALPPREQWGAFILVDRLGSGTSADVFRAYEPRLDRHVALKLFKPGASSSEDRRAAMLQEARALARVRHPNVVCIHGADEIDDVVGIWMELVVGRSLEAELRERGAWTGPEAAAAGVDICQALSAVHAAGFVHGDIKATNVVREDSGRLVLMDFGARQVLHAGPRERLTGTPLYLAPEVLTTRETSVESDVYSLGVLLHHLVTGGYPVAASSLESLRKQHRRRATQPVTSRADGVDPGLQHVLDRALAPNPADRFHSAAEMGEALKRLLPDKSGQQQRLVRTWLPLALLAATVLILASLAYRSFAPAPPDSASIAVLPFRTGGQEIGVHLSEGISADLTSLLARLPNVRVVSGVSVQQFKDTGKPAQEIGRVLGARTLVAGLVQMSGEDINVNVELVDTSTGKHVWGQTFRRRAGDLFAAQSDIARSIASQLQGRLSPEDAQRLERPPMAYQAFDLYSLGRYHWAKRTRDGLQKSIEYFTRAAADDPSSALPYAGLSDAYVQSSVYGLDTPRDAQLKAEAAALQAVALDPNLAEAHAALGGMRQEQLRWDEARAELVRAIELKPNYASARHWYALHLTGRGEFDEAINQMRQAVAQDPLSVALQAALAFIYYMQGDFPTALHQYGYAADLEGDRSWLRRHMALAYLANGQPDEALNQLDLVPQGTESPIDLNAIRATAYALLGRTVEARGLVVPVTFAASDAPFSALDQAAAQCALGDKTLAYEWVGRAIDNREHDVQYLAVDPRFKSLRAEGTYLDLLKRTGVELKPELKLGGAAR